nr:PREDICTED: transcription initiation factor TFIID subunit 4-like [Apteryx mantelli mantelli]
MSPALKEETLHISEPYELLEGAKPPSPLPGAASLASPPCARSYPKAQEEYMRLSDVFRFYSSACGPSPDTKASAAAPAAAPCSFLLAVPPAADEVPAPEHARVCFPGSPARPWQLLWAGRAAASHALVLRARLFSGLGESFYSSACGPSPDTKASAAAPAAAPCSFLLAVPPAADEYVTVEQLSGILGSARAPAASPLGCAPPAPSSSGCIPPPVPPLSSPSVSAEGPLHPPSSTGSLPRNLAATLQDIETKRQLALQQKGLSCQNGERRRHRCPSDEERDPLVLAAQHLGAGAQPLTQGQQVIEEQKRRLAELKQKAAAEAQSQWEALHGQPPFPPSYPPLMHHSILHHHHSHGIGPRAEELDHAYDTLSLESSDSMETSISTGNNSACSPDNMSR